MGEVLLGRFEKNNSFPWGISHVKKTDYAVQIIGELRCRISIVEDVNI